MKEKLWQYVLNLDLWRTGKLMRYADLTGQKYIKIFIAGLDLLLSQYETYNGEIEPLTPEEIKARSERK